MLGVLAGAPTLKGSLTTAFIIGYLNVAALAIEEPCTASRTAGDSPSASRFIGDSASVSVASAHRLGECGLGRALSLGAEPDG